MQPSGHRDVAATSPRRRRLRRRDVANRVKCYIEMTYHCDVTATYHCNVAVTYLWYVAATYHCDVAATSHFGRNDVTAT